MNWFIRYKGTLLVLSVTSLFLLWNFLTLVLHPTEYLFNSSGDGIKNTYTFLWHILYDTELTTSNAMNFPFGNSVFYIDAQPAFSIPFQQLQKFLGLEGSTWLIVFQYLLLLSIPLSSYILYRLIVLFYVDWYWAALFSVGLVLNSPQIQRLTGHFGLSYSWVILLSISLLYQYLNTKNWRYYAYLLLTILLGFFIHPYLGVIPFLFTLTALVVQRVLLIKKGITIKAFLSIIGTFLPLLLLLIVTFISDNHIGRPKNPYGFYEYTSSLKGLFSPPGFSLPDWIDLIDKKGATGEDYNYLGISGIVLLVVSLIAIINKIRQSKSFEISSYNLEILLISSIVLLLFSFGLPFVFGLENILEKFPSLKAFRALGRFAWPFYFLISVYGIVQIQSWISNDKQILKGVVFGVLSVFFIYEGNRNMSNVSDGISSIKLFDNQVNNNVSKEYAAILPLPYYNIGTDNYTSHGSDKSMLRSYILSLNTNIPLMSNLSARQSIQEAKKSMSLIGRYDFEKSMDFIHFTDKKILICNSGESLNKNEKELLEKSNEIDNTRGLFELQAAELFNGKWRYEEKSANELFFLNFENKKSEVAFRGEGSLELGKRGFSKVCDISKGTFDTGKHLLQFWVYTGGENYGEGRANNCFIVIEEKDESGNVNWLNYAPINNSFVYDGDWCLVEIPFQINDNQKEISIQLSGNDKSGITVIIDELRMKRE